MPSSFFGRQVGWVEEFEVKLKKLSVPTSHAARYIPKITSLLTLSGTRWCTIGAIEKHYLPDIS
jgi:hypothetical protein